MGDNCKQPAQNVKSNEKSNQRNGEFQFVESHKYYHDDDTMATVFFLFLLLLLLITFFPMPFYHMRHKLRFVSILCLGAAIEFQFRNQTYRNN